MTKERAAKIILDMINGAESTYGHSLSTTEIIALKKAYCALNPEPTTNEEHIRAMTDEELAYELTKLSCCLPTTIKESLTIGSFETLSDAFYWWLKQEAKE